MAFPNRVGNLLKQNVSKHVSSVYSASSPSLFQATRCRSLSAATKLVFEEFPYTSDEDSLAEEFSQFGSVLEVRLHRSIDHETNIAQSFGFVTYVTTEAAYNAIKAFDGRSYKGMGSRVRFATEKPLGYGGGSGYYGAQGGGYDCGGNQGRGNYSSGDGNYVGDSSYGGGNQFSGGGGYGGYDDSLQGGGGGNYSGNKPGFASLLNNDTSSTVGGGNYFGNKPNFASLLNDDPSGAIGGTQGPLCGDQGEIEGGNDAFD